MRRAARWSCLVKPSSLGNFSTLFHHFGGAAEERFETKKYPKLPVVSARDGTEADGLTPPEQHRSLVARGEVFERVDCDLGPSLDFVEVRVHSLPH